MSTYPKPFDHKLFSDIPKYEPPKLSEDALPRKISIGQKARIASPKRPEIKEFCIVSVQNLDKKSDFYHNKEKSAHEQEIKDGENFYFAPGVDDVCVAWKIENPTMVEKVKWELFSVNDKANSIWSLEKTSDKAQEILRKNPSEELSQYNGSMKWVDLKIPKNTKIGDDSDAFPDECVTVGHTPYQLRMTITPKNTETVIVAWTYFDVLVDEIKIEWGADKLIPTADRGDHTWPPEQKYPACEDFKIRDKELAIMAKLRANVPAHAKHEIELESAIFRKTQNGDKDNWVFDNYKKMWGQGPRVPLVAKVTIKSIAGDGTDKAPKAIGNTSFLWDWTDLPFNDGDYGVESVRKFLKETSERPAGDGTAPPGSINCHKDHGGKRGGDPVFPKQNEDKAPQAVDGEFPYKVIACKKRKWASFSHARTGGDHAGTTGVLFQPSRMPGDTYKVRVMLAKPRAEIDCTDKQDKLLSGHEKLPTDVTGVFKIFRKVDLTYLRKRTSITAMSLDATKRYYKEAGIKINVVSDDGEMDEEKFKQCLEDWKRNPGFGTNGRVGPRLLDPTYNQSHGNQGLTFQSWAQVNQRYRAAACQQYAYKTEHRTKRKQRKRQKQFNDFRAAYKQNHPGCDDIEAMAAWYDDLNPDQQQKVDAIKQQDMTTDEVNKPNEAEYKKLFPNISKAILQTISGKYMKDEMTKPGIFFVHYEYKTAWRDLDGTLTMDTVDVGGIAPYGENDIDRAIFLLYMPSADPGGTVMKPHDVTAHEIGHNLCLKHAKCYRDDTFSGPSPDESLHIVGQDCLMNYDRQDTKNLCGFCSLRVRGWSTTAGAGVVKLSNDSSENKG